MRKFAAMLFVFGLLSTSCIGGGANTRTVLVDFTHDQFASYFTQFFPTHVTVHPGDTVVFRQTWTGEPHSVTMGTEIDKLGKVVKPFIPIYEKKGFAGLPPEPPKALSKYENELPWMVKDNGEAAQNGAQRCFLARSLPPKDQNKPCRKAQQRQPEFTGRYKYYNSGFIPYQGPNGDTYTVKIAKNAKPGEHFFYCNYHGELMSGFLQIKPKNESIPSQNAVSADARRRIDKSSHPLLRDFNKARRGTLELPKDALPLLSEHGLVKKVGRKSYFKGWLEGLGSDGVDNGLINEFIPKRLTAKVGQKLTWAVVGDHTLSFNVPKYFPIIQTLKDGTVRVNPKLQPPHGGAPRLPEQQQEGPSKPVVVDAGNWDGKGFWSSGLMEAFDSPAIYSLTITKPGTYKFACLVHPPMVGTLVVKP